MKPSLFSPRQFAVPPSLVLVPYFPQGSLFAGLQKQARRRQDLLHATLMWFDNMAVLSGFLGYPHLLTLLGLVADLADKEIYFLGSAGAIHPRFREPQALQVGVIHPSSIFTRFAGKNGLPLRTFAAAPFPVACGVSVDMIQRETPSWLATQRSRGMDIVEMELFPLRWFLRKPFHALVVLSDRVDETGIRPFPGKEKFKSEFERACQYILSHIRHG